MVVFGILYLRSPYQWFWLFPAVFGGAVPVLQGLVKMIQSRQRDRLDAATGKQAELLDDKQRERHVLRVAKDNAGRLTPGMVALESPLSMEEAEKELDRISKSGYARVEVNDSGRLEYIFDEFLPRLEE